MFLFNMSFIRLVIFVIYLSPHLQFQSSHFEPVAGATSDNPLLTFESLYEDGVNSYLENNWASCVRYLELALEDWRWWHKNIARCRETCYEEVESFELIFPKLEAYEYDRMFEKIVVNTLCLVKCKKRVFGSRMKKAIPKDVIQDFEARKTYDYLQLCYYKQGQLDKAANAAATFLATDPEHEVMQTNIQFYVKQGGLRVDDIVNMELQDYALEYLRADDLYQSERYSECIPHLERSLALFWGALRECRLGCEAPFDQGWLPDFLPSLANHYTFTLRCKLACPHRMANFYGEQVPDLVASIFNYLQFSYFKVGDLASACEAVESYLTLDPSDPSQGRNKQFFWTQEDVKEEFFTPRESVLSHKARLDYETRLLTFIDASFEGDEDGGGAAKQEEREEEEKEPGASPSTLKKLGNLESRRLSAVAYLKSVSGRPFLRLVADSKELGGKRRFLAEGVLSKERCQEIAKFTQISSVEGDGYKDRRSPHTAAEAFQGVTLARAAMVVLSGVAPATTLEAILEASDFSKAFLERHFELERDSLFFSFTHLVCRTGIGDPSLRAPSDLSHSLHADNCLLQPDGGCLRQPPAYTFRDYSAILYLNSDFEGGEFIFSRDTTGQEYESVVKPRCGRLVGFSAGEENLHAVRPVWRGTRCGLAMWFTFQAKYREVERTLATRLVTRIQEGQITPGDGFNHTFDQIFPDG